MRHDAPLPLFRAQAPGRWGLDVALVSITEELLKLGEEEELKTCSYLPFSLVHRLKNRLWQVLYAISHSAAISNKEAISHKEFSKASVS